MRIRNTAAVCMIILAASLSGCNQEQIGLLRTRTDQAQQIASTAQQAVADAQTVRDATVTYIATLPPAEQAAWADKLAKADKILADLTTGAAKANETLQRLQTSLASAESAPDVAQGIVDAAAPLVPAPWGTIGAAIAGLAIGLWRSATKKKAALAIARAVEAAKIGNIVNFADPNVATMLTANLGAAGNAIVDEAQGKRTTLPF